MGAGKSRTCRPNETCVICQEDVADNVSRPDCCPDHFFHHDCLMKWAEHKNTCPLDNRVFNHVVDLRGKKHPVPKRKQSDEDSSTEFLRRMLAILAMLNNTSNTCELCGQEAPERERAELPCGHKFHRFCLVKMARITDTCPVDNCGKQFNQVKCEFGETLDVTSFRPHFVCNLCHKGADDDETASPDCCSHRFHRSCLVKKCVERAQCPQCDQKVRFLKCDLGERVVIDNGGRQLFTCGLCHREDPSKEETSAVHCGHLFHRECVLGIFRSVSVCPMDNCSAPLDSIKCQFGDEFGHSRSSGSGPQINPLAQVLCEVTCDDDFRCEVCEERRANEERAKLPCGCEFHRQCITNLARTMSDKRCPKCQSRFNTIICMFGAVLTLSESPGDRTSQQEERTEEISEDEEGARNEAVGAAGNQEAPSGSCSFCNSRIDAGMRCRSSTCEHDYHRVCLESIKEFGGNCVVCQKPIAQTVSMEDVRRVEQGATAGPSPLECSLCHSEVPVDERVHPNVCNHLYHLKCLASEISKRHVCSICGKDMTGMLLVQEEDEKKDHKQEKDEFTGERCIICTEAIPRSNQHCTVCCQKWMHQQCLSAHLKVIRECPFCEKAMPE